MFIRGLLLVGLALMMPNESHLCAGFLPPNTRSIPVGVKSLNNKVTKAQFNEVISRAQRIYGPIIRNDFGANLRITGNWSSSEVNAYASRWGSTYQVTIMGGLAREKDMTADAVLQVVCHEIGHHIGGAPQYRGDWASGEGQSDYFGTLKCMRRMFSDQENLDWLANNDVHPTPQRECADAFSSPGEQARCMRTAMASLALGLMVQEPPTAEPDFDTPDQSQVGRTDNSHPRAQCRLDTYYQGGLCNVDVDDAVSNRDPKRGACNRSTNHSAGVRPRCWYRPS